jgi:hypothetical protein
MATPRHHAPLLVADAARVEAGMLDAPRNEAAARPTLTGDPWREPRLRAYRAPLLGVMLAVAAITVAWLAPGAALDGAGRALDGAREHNDAAGRAVLTTLLAASALLLLVARWGSRSSPRRALRLPDGGGRLAVIELAVLLQHELTASDAVEAAHVRVENRHRRGVAVAAVVEVVPEARLADAGAEARARLAEVVEERIGLALAAPPRVELRYRELRLRPATPRLAGAAERPALHALAPGEVDEGPAAAGGELDRDEEGRAAR